MKSRKILVGSGDEALPNGAMRNRLSVVEIVCAPDLPRSFHDLLCPKRLEYLLSLLQKKRGKCLSDRRCVDLTNND